jgi:hypothetical protein
MKNAPATKKSPSKRADEKAKAVNPANPTTPSKARRLEDLARGRSGAFGITPTLIQTEPGFNGREDLGCLRTLAADIEANGLLQPLKIRKDPGTENIWLIDGHRRHAAITTILIPENRWPADREDPSLPAPVHCTAEPRNTRPIDRLFMQLSMNSGKPLTFLEEAGLYLRILTADSTLKPADIARRTGKTKQAISDSLRLVKDGCPLLLENVRHGTLAASTALAIIKSTTTPAEQETALQDALERAHQAGRSGVMPKDLAAKPDPAPATQHPEEQPSTPAPAPAPQPAPGKPTPATSSTTFRLFVIPDAPEEPADPEEPSRFHETDRLVLLHPPTTQGIHLLHLLSASTHAGVAYGYRINDITRLPDLSDLESFDAPPAEGFACMLRDAARRLGLDLSHITPSPEELLNSAMARYFPDSGTPEEPETLAFVAPSAGPSQTPAGTIPDDAGRTGHSAILAAPTGGGNNGGGGGGGSSYLDPQTFKAVQGIEEILEALADSPTADPARVTTVEIVLGVLRKERPAADLKKHLTR